MSCTLCGGEKLETLFDSEDYVTQTRCRITRCMFCGVGITVPPAGSLDNFYPVQYRRYRSLVVRVLKCNYRRMVRQWTAGRGQQGRVLEIGCGPGWMLEEFAALGWTAVGLERLEVALAYSGKARIYSGFEALPVGERFNLVLLFQALEHMSDPLAVLRECRNRMPEGSRLIISVPNFASWQARWAKADWLHLDAPRHLFHFTPSSLRTLLGKAGFKVTDIRPAAFGHDVYGWVQSLQDKIGMERHALTCMLMHQPRKGGFSQAAAAAITAALVSTPAILLTAVSWLVHDGALLQLEALAE